MKKLYFGFVLMICGSIILTGGLIGGGAEVSGINVNINRPLGIGDSSFGLFFVIFGMFIFLIGLVTAKRNLNSTKDN